MKESAMTKLNRVFIAAASLMVFQLAIADNAVPSYMIEQIYPPYRTGDMHNFSGEAMVRVTEITGQDRDGQTVVLFRDRTGALIPLIALEGIERLINPAVVEKKGEYRDLVVRLADELLIFNKLRIEHTPLPPQLGGPLLRMQGSVYISKYEVTTGGF
jgi:hypothetical protein